MRRNPDLFDERERQEARERSETWTEALELEWRKRRYADRADEEDAQAEFRTARERGA